MFHGHQKLESVEKAKNGKGMLVWPQSLRDYCTM